jgi:Mesyanzhinovviridae DNA helicase
MTEYQPKTEPYEHQREAARRLAARPRGEDVFAYLCEMGTGKSKMVIDEWGASGLDDLLVVAPAGVYRNWEATQIPEHLGTPLAERAVVAPWVSGGGVGATRRLAGMLGAAPRPRIMLCNVEALSSVKAARAACAEFLGAGRAMMVVDESTFIRSHSAQRTKAVNALGQIAKARRICSGLATPRSPLDLYSQFQFLDWRIIGQRSYWGFRARYAVMQDQWFGGRRVPIVVGYKNLKELQERIAPWSYRVLKEDCLDLPPKVYEMREVALSPEQKRLYTEIRDNATAKLNEMINVTATSAITQILRLHQLLCGVVVDDAGGGEHEVPEQRTEALIDLLAEHGGKALVWVPYRAALRRVAARLRKEYGERTVVEFWGDTGAEARLEADRRFQGDPECRFSVGTPQAGGLGRTLTAASLVVYYANSWDLEHRVQSEDRAHRAGLTHKVTYVDLIAPNTVDEKIVRALRKKINLAAMVQGDKWREWLV